MWESYRIAESVCGKVKERMSYLGEITEWENELMGKSLFETVCKRGKSATEWMSQWLLSLSQRVGEWINESLRE